MITTAVAQWGIVGFILNLWPLWFLLAGILGFLTYKNNKKIRNHKVEERVLLLLEIPRANEKKELAAEQMFASLHGILRSRKELIADGSMQEHLSMEIAAIGKRLRFYISVPAHLKNFVEGQVYAQYPTVQIYTLTEDYADREITQSVKYSAELTLIDQEVLPIKTFPSFEVDPLAAVTATLAKLDDDDEEMWIQVLARPIDDSWHKRSSKATARIKAGKGMFSGGFGGYIGQLFSALIKPPEESGAQKAPEVSERDRGRITAIEEKSTKLGYQVKVRFQYLGNDQTTAKLRMQAMVGTFKQFNSTNLNGFMQAKASFNNEDAIAHYKARHFIDHGYILNIEELASLFHLPHTSVETPNIVWATSKTAEPPATLPAVGSVDPQEFSPFGMTNFRGTNTQFGLKRGDRGRHVYIIGQTGTGKSGLLQLLTLSDIYYNQGFAVIDPHGDYAIDTMRHIPAHRVEDVVYFNPADTEFPIAFNPMEVTDPSLKNHISSELVGVLKRMFESWGPRLEYILRYTILALLDYPDSTMLDITRMLTEKDFRNKVISHLTDPVVKNFWTVEFASWNEKFASEAVAPVLNKVGAFTANPMVRNIVGQPTSAINLRHIMDNGKILLVNLSRGLVGEDNASILGALMVTKIQLAAMSRANIADIADRRPFYLYVDEFQNFATDSFAVILSEARKYGLNLTIANQYVSQMPPEVRDAVFGNVGTTITFRVGADDATALQKYFEPQFESQDLIQLHNRHLVTSMAIDGEKTPAFSATTLMLPPAQDDHSAEIIQHSRHMYARPKAEVEASINIAPEPKYSQPQRDNTNQQHQKSQHVQNTNTNAQKSTPMQQRQKNQPNRPKIQSDAHLKKNRQMQKQRAVQNQPERRSHGKFENDDVISLR